MPNKHRIGLLLKLVFLLALFCCALWANSQTYYLENYSVRQGLPNSKVYDLLQDENGYIWLATPSGLSRFDGESFSPYGLQEGLDESSVRALFLDRQSRLWVGFENGKVFVKDHDHFKLVLSDTINSKGEVSDITQNQKGQIFIATIGAGLYLVDNPLEKTQSIRHFQGKDGIDPRIFKATGAHDGRVFFATSVDMKYMMADTIKFDYYRPDGFPRFFLTTCMLEDQHQNLWIGKYNGGLYKQDAQTGIFQFYDHRDGLANNWVSTIFEDSKGRIWVGTWGGGVSLIQDDSIQMNFNEKNGLVGLNIQKITEDSEGNIYIATHENGFYIFKGKQFKSMTEENGLPNTQIWDICQTSNDQVFLATNKGIVELKFSPSGKITLSQVFTQDNDKLISNKIRKLESDSEGNIWIGTNLSGIQKYNTHTNKFDFDYILNSNLPKTKVIHDLQVVDDELYIATLDGLINHEIKTKKNHGITQTNGLSDNDISTLYLGKNKRLWVGIRNGGVNFIDQNNEITYLKKTAGISPICFTEDNKGNLWVGTFKGVFKLVDDSLIQIVDERSGLLSNYVSVLHFIDDKRLIIGSNNGLNIYYLESGKIIHYNKNVGYTGIETKTNSFLDRGDGILLFGTTGGLMIYDSKTQDRKLMEPYVHITKMRVNMQEQEMHEDAVYPYDQNSFSFNYHAISLTNQPDLEYKVMLKGQDIEWREATQNQNISFSQLPPGKYEFLVKAITFDGVENEIPVSYSFKIKPPFWETWWFISSSLLIIIASTVFGVRYRIYLLKKEKKVLEQKVVDRTKEISQKNEQLAEKNKHITDSINYARRIQYATMRPEEHLISLYPQAFILYIPKDIVSGDFYWYVKKGKQLIVAAADCTGHGVPGAFMSMLGIAYLNEIVGRMNKFVSSDILEKLRANVIGALHQSDSADTAKDGMDIALMIYDTDSNRMQFSGAYNPMYLIRNGEMTEYKGDRMPIGVHSRDKEPFTNHEVDLLPGDQLFIFTDGYADQFGGPKGKKMNYKRFKNMLLENSNLPLIDQRTHLLENFTQWKGKQEQLDDVLVISIKV